LVLLNAACRAETDIDVGGGDRSEVGRYDWLNCSPECSCGGLLIELGCGTDGGLTGQSHEVLGRENVAKALRISGGRHIARPYFWPTQQAPALSKQ
jgi:hypothetical protein